MIYVGPPNNLHQLAAFLETMNSIDASHIGYCGEEEEEIFDTLSDDFSDIDIEKSFVVAYEEDHLVGALGFDIDAEKRSAEVWGPFVGNGKDKLQIADDLWKALENTIPFKLDEYQFFINDKNTFVKQFVGRMDGIENGHHLILTTARDNIADRNDLHVVTYDSSFMKSFSELHQLAFPNTYYSSEQILSRISKDNLLLIIQHDMELKGYVYVEASPLHGEGAIEYIAVSPDYRGQGLAKKLMKAALHHLFSYDSIEEITLSVESSNKAAIALYMDAGFRVKHTLVAYKK